MNLAGLIDGDGDIRIKRKNYSQCLIRISSGHRENLLKNSIENNLNCSVHITQRKKDKILDGRVIHGRWYELEFLVSSKNYKFIRNLVIPFITIKHKKKKLKRYISARFK